MAANQFVNYHHTVTSKDFKKYEKALKEVALHLRDAGELKNLTISKRDNHNEVEYLLSQIWSPSAKHVHWDVASDLPQNIRDAIKTMRSCYTPTSQKGQSPRWELVEKIF